MEKVEASEEYLIKVAGALDPSWSEWLGGLAIQVENEHTRQPVSLLAGKIADQAYLRGILIKIWDLNLKIISVSLVQAAGERPEKEGANHE